MHIDLPGWAWGTLAFVALQVLALLVGVAGNLYTPVFKAQMSAIGAGIHQWRTFRITLAYYQTIFYRRYPHSAIARIIIYTSLATMMYIFSIGTAILTKIERKSAISIELLNSIPKMPDEIAISSFLVSVSFGAYLSLYAIRQYVILLYPGTERRRLEQLARRLKLNWADITDEAQSWMRGERPQPTTTSPADL